LDRLAANLPGYALYPGVFVDPVRPANLARFISLDRLRAAEFSVD
jgi:hypothetical protein